MYMCPASVPICRSYSAFSLKEAWLTPGLKQEATLPDVSCVFGVYISPCCFTSIRINMIYHLICCRLLFTVSATLFVLSFISLTQAVLTGRWQFWWIKHAWTCNQTHCISASWHSKSVLWFSNFRTFFVLFFSKNQWRTPTPKSFCYLSFVCWLRFALEGSPVPGCSSLESPSLTPRGSPPGHRRAKLMIECRLFFAFNQLWKRTILYMILN